MQKIGPRKNSTIKIFYSFKGKNYVPRNDKLRQQIVELFHDHETAGHPGELEIFNAVQQYYWWPGLRTFVKNYVKGCGICQQFKIDRNPSKPTFLPVEGATSTRLTSPTELGLLLSFPPLSQQIGTTFDNNPTVLAILRYVKETYDADVGCTEDGRIGATRYAGGNGTRKEAEKRNV